MEQIEVVKLQPLHLCTAGSEASVQGSTVGCFWKTWQEQEQYPQ